MAVKGIRKVYYTAMCTTHGTRGRVDVVPWVKVGVPSNKRKKMGGCPVCKVANRQNK